MKNNVYPCKPQFFYIKVGFKGVKFIQACFRDVDNNSGIIFLISPKQHTLWILIRSTSEDVLIISTHNINCFYGEVEKIILEASPNTPP